ncbi:MAG: hypothetical protein Q9191_007743 [Dirinaria sp. TL-2023a]
MVLQGRACLASTEECALGAGSGGASSAFYLHRAYPCPLNVTVYERENYIGGRSTTVGVYGDSSVPVELGASIFVNVNYNLVSAVERFNLSTVNYGGEDLDGLTKGLGVWNGEKFVFIQSDASYDWWNTAKLLWRYGMSPIRTQRLMKDTVSKFLKMYETPIFPFKSIGETALELGLLAPSMRSEQLLKENAIYAPFSTDIIQASTRVNYAQNLAQIHGLEAMVCMATDGAMSVNGGNWQIFDKMLKHDKNTIVLNTSVSDISIPGGGKQYSVTSSSSGADLHDATSTNVELFDNVVLAAPLQFANITINPSPAFPPSPIPYVTLYVTLFTSPYRPNPDHFNVRNPSDVPTIILTTLPEEGGSPPPFFSLSTLRTVVNPNIQPPQKEYLYKIFSPTPLPLPSISEMLNVPPDLRSLSSIYNENNIITWQYNKTWHSYPYLPPRVTFDDPQLDEAGRLWYTSGIEPFISTMETSSLMGKNVAHLIVDGWLREQTSAEGED